MRGGLLATLLLTRCASVAPYIRHPPADNYQPYVRRDVYVPFEPATPPPPQDDCVMQYPMPGCAEDDCTVPEPAPSESTPTPWLPYGGWTR